MLIRCRSDPIPVQVIILPLEAGCGKVRGSGAQQPHAAISPIHPHCNRMAPGCLGQVALKLSNKGFGSLKSNRRRLVSMASAASCRALAFRRYHNVDRLSQPQAMAFARASSGLSHVPGADVRIEGGLSHGVPLLSWSFFPPAR